MIVPGQEAVTVYARNAAPANDTFTSYAVTARGRPSKGKSDSAAGALLANTEKTWHLYRPSLNAAGFPADDTPDNFDYLVDANGTKWVVKSVDAKSNWSFVIVQTRQAV